MLVLGPRRLSCPKRTLGAEEEGDPETGYGLEGSQTLRREGRGPQAILSDPSPPPEPAPFQGPWTILKPSSQSMQHYQDLCATLESTPLKALSLRIYNHHLRPAVSGGPYFLGPGPRCHRGTKALKSL